MGMRVGEIMACMLPSTRDAQLIHFTVLPLQQSPDAAGNIKTNVHIKRDVRETFAILEYHLRGLNLVTREVTPRIGRWKGLG